MKEKPWDVWEIDCTLDDHMKYDTSGELNIRMSKELLARLRNECKRSQLCYSHYIVRLIEHALSS